MELQLLNLKDKEGWNLASRDLPISIYQTWAYCNALFKTQKNDIYLLKISDANNTLLLTFSKRAKKPEAIDIFSPYGFGGFSFWGDEFEHLLHEFEIWCSENGIVTAYLMGYPSSSDKLSVSLSYKRSAFIINLNSHIDELWKKINYGHRYEINKISKRNDVEIISDKSRLLPSLLHLYRKTLTRVGANNSYYFTEDTLTDLVNQDACIILGASVSDDINCIVMICYTSFRAEYFINASTEEGKSMTRLLLWEAIKQLNKLGISEFNIGGGANEGDHLEDFKKRFGGNRFQIPVYKKVINLKAFESLCELYNNNTNETYFPPYWKI